jgi:acetyltransferase-like isoleucine patch superfamily enzyme
MNGSWLRQRVRRSAFQLLIRLADSYERMALYDRWLKFGAVGRNVRVTGLVDFGSEPSLLSFGDDVTIADGVRFLTHDGAAALFRKEFPGLSVTSPISVGTNVFIGSDSLILAGVSIGDNTVIGAGAVVTKDVASHTVVAGNPARPIKSLADYRRSVREKGVFDENSR